MVKRLSKEICQIAISIGLIMSILSLFGCSFSTSLQKEPSLDEIAQLIVEAFEENSVDPIKGVLSESALATGDLQDGLSYGHGLMHNLKMYD